MASAVDTYSDLDISDSDEGDGEIDKLFHSAADHVKSLVGKLESSKILELYGLFKQSTVGPCNISKPSWYELQAKQKWDAWNALKDISPEEAREKYVQLVKQLDPTWNSLDSPQKKTKNHWITVSSLQNNSCPVAESEKTVFDFCKDGDIKKVGILLDVNPKSLTELESGLCLIHWAVDRGHTDMVKMLLERGCDVNIRDDAGQTPLHYATSCGHVECVTILLEGGADKTLLDEDGLTPIDCATKEIQHLLQ